MVSDPRDLALSARAWPFEEARKVVARVERAGARGNAVNEVLFETGYGPSGLPHIGTFGEVARTTWVRRAFDLMSTGCQDAAACDLRRHGRAAQGSGQCA